VQLQIFWFSAELASESETPSPKQRYVSTEDIAALEQAIDNAMSQVDNVHSFVCQAAAKQQPVCMLPGHWPAKPSVAWWS
jgi:cob(I)alamin adenosyltransferase